MAGTRFKDDPNLGENEVNITEEDIRKAIIRDDRPWGNFIRYAHNQLCTVKIITVNANQKLSKQAHKHRDELWVFIDDGLRVERNNDIIDPKEGEVVVIMRGMTHRVASLGNTGRFLEISFGEFDEDDIERYDDDYGRA
jgi:mannose-1-phosphate guanylyltransferase/mannose-6-phosphate isomerase